MSNINSVNPRLNMLGVDALTQANGGTGAGAGGRRQVDEKEASSWFEAMGSKPLTPVATSPSAMPWTSSSCMPQKSAICLKLSVVLSTSQTAVALAISGLFMTFSLTISLPAGENGFRRLPFHFQGD